MIPYELREYCQWVVWRLETVDNKPKKVPYSPVHPGERAKVYEPLTWGTYEEACQAAPAYDGIGFVFTRYDPFAAIDMNHCMEDRVLTDEAYDVMKSLGSYTEASPSGTGIHIIGRGKFMDDQRAGIRRGNIEIYTSGRFLTMTGETILDTLIVNVKIALEYMEIAMTPEDFMAPLVTPKTRKKLCSGGLRPADKALLKRIFQSKQGELMQQLFEGKNAKTGDPSRDDLYFCWQVNFYTHNDFTQTDRIFRNSKRMRRKWDEVHYADGMTYGAHTLAESYNKENEDKE